MFSNELIKNKDILISVIMPCYNHETYVISALESVAASDYNAIEFIFIDDASKDNSFNLATKWFEKNKKRFVRVVCIQHENNCGICHTLNELCTLAQGEFISPLASDDQLLPTGLSIQLKYALVHKVDFIFSDYRLINESGELIAESAFRYFGRDIFKLKKNQMCLCVDLIFNWSPPWNKHFFSANLLKRIGMFDESLTYEDRDFIIRVLIDGSFALLSDSTANYRIRLSNRLTPGLEIDGLMDDFHKSDRKNYLAASGIVRFFLAFMVYSFSEKYHEIGIRNTKLIWLATSLCKLVKRLIVKTHMVLVK